jgi:molybdate transport system permease protein
MRPVPTLTPRTAPAWLAAIALLGLLVLPAGALVLGSSPSQLAAGVRHPLFLPALWLSARTTLVSLLIVVVAGTPLAWWLARESGRIARGVQLLVDLPIVLPPAVVGVALLRTFGRGGLLGPLFEAIGWQVPFTTVAVVLAQVAVSAPFYIQSGTAAFRRVDPDLLIVARTLGQTASGAFFRVAVPVALPGLIAGAALAWARSIGEFGATLLFAGSLPGRTQTMPLAILTALESDVDAALAISVVLAAIAILLLLGLRLAPSVWVPGAGGNGRWKRQQGDTS